MVRAFVFVAVAAACVMLQAQAGPQTPPVFHAGVHLVTVDVSVLDNDYRVVHGLSAGDFKIFENGVPQKVAAFSEVNIPDAEGVPGSWNREVAPDVRTNGADDGRLVILLLDDAMARADEGGMPAATGLSKEQRAALPPEAMKESAVSIATKAIARAVVDRLGPADRAAVIFTFEKQGTQDFTTDRARLRASIDRFVPKQFAAGGGAPYDWRRVSLDASASVARYLASIPNRRKSLIFISVGIPVKFDGKLSTNHPPGDDLAMMRAMTTMEQAQRSNVNVYAFNPAGFKDVVEMQRLEKEATTDSNDVHAARVIETSLANSFIHTLAHDTGGFSVERPDEFNAAITQLYRESGSYYLLGYVPAIPPTDKAFRQIDVQVSRPDVVARSRAGYFPNLDKDLEREAMMPASMLFRAITGVIPDSTIPMQASAVPYAIPGKHESAVAIALGIREPAPPGPVVENVGVFVRASNQRGDYKRELNTAARLTIRPGEGAENGTAFEVITSMPLKPGNYELRISAKSHVLNEAASVYVDVEVPDFDKLAFALSGLALSAAPGLPAAPNDHVLSVLPVEPTTLRTFSGRDRVTAFMRVYQRAVKTPGATVVSASILSVDDARVFEDRTELRSDAFADAREADYRLELPIRRLRPGSYLLRLDAVAGSMTARREIRFSIR